MHPILCKYKRSLELPLAECSNQGLAHLLSTRSFKVSKYETQNSRPTNTFTFHEMCSLWSTRPLAALIL